MVNYIKSEDNKTKAVVSAVGFFNDLAAGSYTFFSSWMKFNNKFHKMVNPALAMVSGAMMLAYNLA
ncbi:MAG: hypothetical protein JWL62_1166 [Hyphomicrobiales bacterium]|nr:hypothetical protein [Hyphomicrobiales bacterium]